MAVQRRVLIERVGKEDLARVTLYRRSYGKHWYEEKVDYMRDRHIPTRLRLMKPIEVTDKRGAY